jgi:hypothetical protein
VCEDREFGHNELNYNQCLEVVRMKCPKNS